MIKFKARIKNSEKWIEGKGCSFESSMNEYVIFIDGIGWVDGGEWGCGNWEIIDITTLIIER